MRGGKSRRDDCQRRVGALAVADRRCQVKAELIKVHMKLDSDDQKARIASLLANVPQFKEWIEDVGGLTTDSQGRTVILGLNAAETEEMILLRATDISGARFQTLRRKHDAARRQPRSRAQHPRELIRRAAPQ